MYKVQVFYDDDTADVAANIAAFRLGLSKAAVRTIWDDRKYFCKGINRVPKLLLQAIKMVDYDDIGFTEEEAEYMEENNISLYDEIYDGDEFWFPLGWDIESIAALMMSSVFELCGCEGYLKVYFYC